MSVIDITIKKVDGTTVEVSIDNTATVADLKKLVQERTEIPKESQRLIFRGQILSDDKTLKDSGLEEDGLTVHLVRHLVPPPHPKAPAATTPTTSGQQQAAPTLRLGATPGSAAPSAAAAGQNPFMAAPSGGMGGMGMSPEAISEMMNNPVVDSMLSNPQIMRSLIEMNPQMQQLMQQNPELRTLIEDPEFLRQTMQAARNPSMMQEMMRTNDRQMANLDSIPGGYQALQRMYRDIQEPMWNAASGAGAHSGSSSASQLMEAMQQDREAGPNNRPLGNPWGTSAPPQATAAANATGTQQQQSSTASRTTQPAAAPAVNPFASMFGMHPPSAASAASSGASGQQGTTPNPTVNPFSFMAFPTPQPTSSGTPSSTTAPASGATGTAQDHHRNPFAEWLSNPAVQDMMGDMMSQMVTQQQQQQQPGAASGNASTTAPPAMPFFFPMGVNPSGTTPSTPQQFNPSAFGSARPAAPAAAAAAVDPAQQFRPQLSALESMGFTNREQNLNALRRANGNVNRALDLLLSEPQE